MTSLDKFSREFQVKACCHQTRRGWPICSRSIRGIKKTDPFAGLWQRMKSRVHAVDGPYDEFCPSLQKDLSNRVCKHCHSCFTSRRESPSKRLSVLVWDTSPQTYGVINEEDDDSDSEIGEKDVDDAGHNHRRLSQQARSSKLMSRKKVTKMKNY